jgi:hypothetical protein
MYRKHQDFQKRFSTKSRAPRLLLFERRRALLQRLETTIDSGDLAGILMIAVKAAARPSEVSFDAWIDIFTSFEVNEA